MARFYYHNQIKEFLDVPDSLILGELVKGHEFALEEQQKNSWSIQLVLLKRWLRHINGEIIFEYSIPRMGRRIDCVLLSGGVVFAVEFKVCAKSYENYAIEQVMDYA